MTSNRVDSSNLSTENAAFRNLQKTYDAAVPAIQAQIIELLTFAVTQEIAADIDATIARKHPNYSGNVNSSWTVLETLALSLPVSDRRDFIKQVTQSLKEGIVLDINRATTPSRPSNLHTGRLPRHGRSGRLD